MRANNACGERLVAFPVAAGDPPGKQCVEIVAFSTRQVNRAAGLGAVGHFGRRCAQHSAHLGRGDRMAGLHVAHGVDIPPSGECVQRGGERMPVRIAQCLVTLAPVRMRGIVADEQAFVQRSPHGRGGMDGQGFDIHPMGGADRSEQFALGGIDFELLPRCGASASQRPSRRTPLPPESSTFRSKPTLSLGSSSTMAQRRTCTFFFPGDVAGTLRLLRSASKDRFHRDWAIVGSHGSVK